MTILVATDFSDNSKNALRLGVKMAKDRGRAVVLMHVVDLAARDNAWRVLVESPDDIERSALKEGRQRLEEFFQETISDVDRPSAVRYEVALGNPIDQLLSHAKTFADPVIIAGTRGGSRLQEFFLGSTAHRLVRQTEKPVVLVPSDTEIKEFEHLLVAVDFSAASRKALRVAGAMAREHLANLHVVHGFIIPEVTALQASMASMTTEIDEIVKTKLASLREMVAEEGVDDVISEIDVRQMSPATAILTMAEDSSADLLFMGTHGRQGWSRFFIGNTAERVMRRVPCPLFVVSCPEEKEK